MLNLKKRFARLISNNFDYSEGDFNTSRLPSLLSSAEREMRNDVALDDFKLYKNSITEEVNLSEDTSGLVSFSSSTLYQENDKVVLIGVNGSEMAEFQTVVSSNDEGTIILYQIFDDILDYIGEETITESWTFYIEADVKYALSNAVIFLTASNGLHQLMGLSQDEGMNSSVSIGTGNLTKLTTSNITDVKKYYKEQYYSAIADYQDDDDIVGGLSITLI